MPLSEQHRAKLDGIVQQMTANKESDETIQTVVNDFKQKYGGAESGAPMGKPRDAFEKAVNYHTGNTLIDAPLGLLQGAAKGAASTGVGIGAIARKVAGLPALPADTFEADTKPEGIGQGTGKFLEQAAEFAAPAGAVTKGLKGAGLLARAGAQAATAGAVSAAQSGGDPTATMTGAALGAGGELVPAALGAAKNGLSSLTEKAPTLDNYAKSFANATPTQKKVISSALPTLQKDGISPALGPHEMQSAVKGKLDELGQAYQNLPAAVRTRTIDPKQVIGELENAQKAHVLDGVVTDKSAYHAIQDQIQTVEQIAAANGGRLNVDKLIHLKQKANLKTSFTSSGSEKDVWRSVGDAYRNAADTVAPEMKPLNAAYQKYNALEDVIDNNIAAGKADTKSGMDALVHRMASHAVGAAAGGELGHMVAGGPGAAVGSIVGGIMGPKLAKSTAQLLQNAVDNGTFQSLPRSKQLVIKAAAKMGDNKAVLRALGQEFALQEAQ
jgi:hypothetical protein